MLLGFEAARGIIIDKDILHSERKPVVRLRESGELRSHSDCLTNKQRPQKPLITMRFLLCP